MAKKQFRGTATGSRLIKDDDYDTYGRALARSKEGMSLSSKEKAVMQSEADKISDFRDRNTGKSHPKDINLPDEKKGKIVGSIDVGERKDSKGNKFRFERPIYGGDPDDPRWDSYRKDLKNRRKR